jgi:hypothetical protein
MRVPHALLPVVFVAGGCQDEPKLVYVPVSPPIVELLVSASATEVPPWRQADYLPYLREVRRWL